MQRDGRAPRRAVRPEALTLEGRQLLAVFFDRPAYIASAPGGVAVVTVRRDFLVGEETAEFATADGTAKAGTNYVETKQTVTFANGEDAKTVVVPLLPASFEGGEKTVALKIAGPEVLGMPPTRAVLTIADRQDITPPTIVATKAIRRGNGVGGLAITFSEAMNPAAAQDPANYYVTGYPSLAYGPRPRKADLAADGSLKLGGAAYDPATNTVTLSFPKPLPRQWFFNVTSDRPMLASPNPVALIYPGTPYPQPPESPITDVAGNKVDGSLDGVPDGHFYTSAQATRPRRPRPVLRPLMGGVRLAATAPAAGDPAPPTNPELA